MLIFLVKLKIRVFSSEAFAKVYFTSPTRGEGKSYLKRDVGVCSPPLMGGGGEGEHLRLLQEPQITDE